MCVCAYTIYLCIYTHIHTHTHKHVLTYTHTDTQTRTHIHTYRRIEMIEDAQPVSEEASTVSSDLSSSRTRKSNKKPGTCLKTTKETNCADALQLTVPASSISLVYDMQSIARMHRLLFGDHHVCDGSAGKHCAPDSEADLEEMSRPRGVSNRVYMHTQNGACHLQQRASAESSSSGADAVVVSSLCARDTCGAAEAEYEAISAQVRQISISDPGTCARDASSSDARTAHADVEENDHSGSREKSGHCDGHAAAGGDDVESLSSSQANGNNGHVDCVGIDAEWRPGDNPVCLETVFCSCVFHCTLC
jgi:hypothetical protein